MIQFTWHAYVIMEINGYLKAINDNKQVEHMKKNHAYRRAFVLVCTKIVVTIT
jgi:hypothetical protein